MSVAMIASLWTTARGIASLRAGLLLTAGALAMAGPAPARAGTVSLVRVVEGDGEIVYHAVFQAAPGERNDVTVGVAKDPSDAARGVLFRDGGAVLVIAVPCRAVDQRTATCTAPAKKWLGEVRVELGDLDDRMRTVTTPDEDPDEGIEWEFTAHGGPGNDSLTAHAWWSRLFGDEGDDGLRVRGEVGDGGLDGGPGDDELWGGRTWIGLFGGGGHDVMHGGGTMRDGDQEGASGDASPGPDVFDATQARHGTVSYLGRQASLRVDLRRGVGGQAGEGDVLMGVRDVEGGSGDDRLLGDDEANVLVGGPGFDRLSGRRGDDWLQPDRGGSRLFCGAGLDTVGERTSSEDRLALDCESLGGIPTDSADRRPARPTLTATGELRYRLRCPEYSDECSAWLHVWQTGGRRRLLAKGAIPLGRWHKRTIALTLTGAGRRLAARRRTVTATLKLHMQEDEYAFTRRWTTRVTLRR